MNRVEIKYYMKVWRWYVPRWIKRDAPEKWDELSGRQLMQVMEVLYMHRSKRDKQILCLKVLMNIRWHLLFGMSNEDIDCMLWLTDYLFAEIDLQKNVIGKLKVGSRHYHGPMDGLKGFTAAEFMDSDMYFMRYLQSSKDQRSKFEVQDRTKVLVDGHDADHWLNMFVAVLYRPMDKVKFKKWNRSQQRSFFRFSLRQAQGSRNKSGMTDLREGFDQDSVATRAIIFKRMPKAMKLAILNWYRSCRNVWEQSLPNVFSGENEKTASSFGWFEVMKNVSAADFGTLEQKEHVPMFTLFLSMEVDMREAKKRKKAREKF